MRFPAESLEEVEEYGKMPAQAARRPEDRELPASPLITVVVATFNMSGFLSTAVKSALAQTYPSIEVLVVDDGSTDDTSEVMRQFAQDARVRYIFQRNQGQAAAKNRGIQEARGELVAFLDADDFWREDKLTLQAALFENAPSVGVVYARYIEVDRDGRPGRIPEAQCFRGRISGPLLVFNFIAFGTSVVRKACFDRVGIFRTDLGMGIDYELWLRISVDYEFDYVAEPLLLTTGCGRDRCPTTAGAAIKTASKRCARSWRSTRLWSTAAR